MRVVIKVEGRDGEVRDVRITPLAIIGWERESGRKFSDLGNSIGMQEIAALVYEQERLAQTTTASSVDEYLRDVVDLDPEVGAPVPTGAGLSPEPSLNSAS